MRPDCANRTYSPTHVIVAEMKIGVVVLGLATSHCPKKCRYVYTPMLSGLRWPGQTSMGSWPPAVIMKKRNDKSRSFTSIQMCHTHTHNTHRQFYTPTLSHTESCVRRRIYTQIAYTRRLLFANRSTYRPLPHTYTDIISVPSSLY